MVTGTQPQSLNQFNKRSAARAEVLQWSVPINPVNWFVNAVMATVLALQQLPAAGFLCVAALMAARSCLPECCHFCAVNIPGQHCGWPKRGSTTAVKEAQGFSCGTKWCPLSCPFVYFASPQTPKSRISKYSWKCRTHWIYGHQKGRKFSCQESHTQTIAWSCAFECNFLCSTQSWLCINCPRGCFAFTFFCAGSRFPKKHKKCIEEIALE